MKKRTAWKWGLAAAALALATASNPGLAQTRPAAPLKLGQVGVFSFLGDSVQAIWSDDKPGATRLEARGSESLSFKGIGFDLIALRVARDALQRVAPSAKVVLFKAPAPLTPAEQRQVAEGASKAELPAWVVQALGENRLTHLVLVTRHRGAASASTGDHIDIGRGTVEGIGFYMDTLYTMQSTDTGALSTGMLAPFAQIRLMLMDANSGDVLSSYDVRESYAYAPRAGAVAADPWNFMPPDEKVRALRQLVERAMDRGMGQLLTPR